MPCKQELAGTCTLEVVVVEIAFGRNEELYARVGPSASLIFGNGSLNVVFLYNEFYIQVLAVVEYLELCNRRVGVLAWPVAAVNGIDGQRVEYLV